MCEEKKKWSEKNIQYPVPSTQISVAAAQVSVAADLARVSSSLVGVSDVASFVQFSGRRAGISTLRHEISSPAYG
jgi:hypothetical protein